VGSASQRERGKNGAGRMREKGADRRGPCISERKERGGASGRWAGYWAVRGPRGERKGEKGNGLPGCGGKEREKEMGREGKGRPRSFCCLVLLLLFFPFLFPHLTIQTILFEFK
jgi:hypothetical protein